MKRYTLRGLIHDAKIFNQLRLEYSRAKKERRKNAFFWAVSLHGWHEVAPASLIE